MGVPLSSLPVLVACGPRPAFLLSRKPKRLLCVLKAHRFRVTKHIVITHRPSSISANRVERTIREVIFHWQAPQTAVTREERVRGRVLGIKERPQAHSLIV